jgi:HD-like signal output (HDOD) protein
MPQFWRYNLYAASASRWLAGKAGVNADLAFTVGLMHGIGQLQLHVAAPAEMLPLDKALHVLDAGRAALEKQKLGFHNCDVAAELAKLWNFPAPIVLALRCVPEPLSPPEFPAAAGCVHLGAWVARNAIQELDADTVLSSFPSAVAQQLGIGLELLTDEMPPVAELSAGLDEMLS